MTALLRSWLAEPLSEDVDRALERLSSAGDVCRIAVMPDVHLARDVCVGTVVATSRRIYPQAVGGDIGCGMAAVRFEGGADLLCGEKAAAALLSGLYRELPAFRHARSALPVALSESPLSHPRLEKLKHRDGRVEFATLGRGNHFLEFQSDEEGALWLMVHSGSRAMGPSIQEHHLARTSKDPSGLGFLEADSVDGRNYLADMEWATAYAEASRREMVEKASRLMESLFGSGKAEASFVSCLHNHVRRETHLGNDLWVHRKGAVSAREGEPGVIPGSMGTPSYHVEGRGCEEALCSSSHGAGRALSRSEARRLISVTQLRQEMNGMWYDHRLAPRLVEEAPGAYKDITKVMRAQGDLTRILRKLRPILCYKAP
jgi:tRNA-splicing ligase RtcB